MPRTPIEKLWLGGAAVVALLIAVVGYFFLVSPQRARTQDVQGQVSSAQLQASTLQSRIVSLTAQQKQAASYRRALAQARAALPDTDDLSANPVLLRSLQSIAQQTSTSVSSLTLGNPTAVVAAVPVATSTDSATSSSPASASTATAQTTPTEGLYSVAITASVSGTSSNLVAFLTRLQGHQPRAVLINSVNIGGGAGGSTAKAGHQTMSLEMTAFVRPSATVGTPAAATPTTTTTP